LEEVAVPVDKIKLNHYRAVVALHRSRLN
jgi:hypothetical protein